jgi:hypothetical protein
VGRVEAKVQAFNQCAIEAETLARAVGDEWRRVRFDVFNARAAVTAKIGEEHPGRGVSEWLAARR